jgi:hypothetical protein
MVTSPYKWKNSWAGRKTVNNQAIHLPKDNLYQVWLNLTSGSEENFSVYFYSLTFPFGEGHPLHLNKLESAFPKDGRLRGQWLVILWSLHPQFQSHCGMWVTVLRMRPYKPKTCVAVGVAWKRTLTAKTQQC